MVHQRFVHSGPLVLGAAPFKSLAPAMDRDRTVSRRSEPSSRTTLMGEQPNPWDRLQPQDVMSRHRGAKPPVDMDSWERLACYPQGSFYPLSDGPSTRYHRITKPYFRTCSSCLTRSQAPFCLYTLRAISGRAEGTFGRLRYSFGGDRPSQTARLTLSRISLLSRLEFQYIKGGIPTSAPARLASSFPCLPPILYVMYQNPMSGYSKAPWGLSVQSRVTCIFTGISISPGPSLRQCPNRYTFRAGRNLPDKEFRYLRTVIVTAAVHRGFSRMLWTNPNILP